MAEDANPENGGQPANDAASAPSERDQVRLFRSEDLFAGARIVLIEHAGEQYRLLITRNDRLILQK